MTKRTLTILAGITWYVGGIVLLLKGGSLLLEARTLRPDTPLPQLAVLGGLCIGGVKAWLLFRKVCKKNLARIAALTRPRIWDFYRLRFYLFLALMILTGAVLSRWAHGNFSSLIGVAVLDLSIGTALLTSSYVFWKKRIPAA
ncbi:MAG: hypothetical protein JSW50_07195 [Candidatus Latescibacterota bacterium]|nr:MAG: hypothetical protein JSW50_07195 [Candidatus Latescibacterota bacterium]